MKKISKKQLVGASAAAYTDDGIAPKWFSPAMREILKDYPTRDDVGNIVDQKLKDYPTKDDVSSIVDQKLKDYPTKDDLDQRLSGFATKDDLKNMSEHLTSIILHYFDKVIRRFDEQDDRFFELFEKNAKAIGNHETRIVSLERRLT